MPSSEKKTLKDLHVASTLGELNKLADSGLPTDSRSVNPATFIKSADKVYLKAKDHDFEGDEENAYVFYMRFFNIITLIKRSNKYTEKKKFYDDLMGKTKTSRAIERAEALQKSLDKRYGKLKAQQEAKAKAEEEAKKKEEEDKKKLMSKSAENNGLDSDEFDLDSLLNGGGISSSADVYQKLKVNHGSILKPKSTENTNGQLISGLDLPSSHTKPDGIPCVSAQDLYNLLTGENVSKVLVLDCRPHSMFLQNHINRPSCINIPAELLDQGVSAGSIERRLQEGTRKIWKKRGEKEYVILMDESTKVADISPECRIQRLKDVIYTFDSYSSLKNEPLFLDGGFHSWLWHYPSLALKPELPKVLPQPKPVAHVDLSSLDYPELPDEKETPSEANKGSIQYPVVSSAASENVPKPFGNTNSSNIAQGHMAPPPSHAPVQPSDLGPGAQIREQPSTVTSFTDPVIIPAQEPKLKPQVINRPVPQSHNGVPIPKTADRSPSYPPHVSSSQPGAPSLPPLNPPPVSPGSKHSVVVGPQSVGPKPPEPGKSVVPPGTAVSGTSVQPSSQPGVPSVDSSTLPTTGQLSVSTAIAPKQFLPNAIPAGSHSSLPSAHPGTASTQTSNTQPSPSQVTSSGSDGSRQLLSGQTNAIVPGSPATSINPTNLTSQLPSVAPVPVTPTVSPSTASSASQPPPVHSKIHGVVTPSGQIPLQVRQTAQPSQPTQVSPASQVPRAGGQISGLSSHSATSPAASFSPGAGGQNNQHGQQAPPNTTPVPSYVNVSGTVQHPIQQQAQIPGKTQVTTSVEHKAPKPPQQYLNKPSSYVTTPGLPPGWERVDNGGRPYYKDHNTQTTHWKPPNVAATGRNVAPESNKQNQQHSQTKRQSSIERPTLHRSLSSPNLAKLSDENNTAPKTPVIDRLSKPDSGQMVSATPAINRGAKPLSAHQLDSFNPSYGGVGRALTGLRNLGNTCYMNSVVQCLSSVAPLAAFFISGAYREDINRMNRDGTRGVLAENFSILIRVLYSGQFKCVSPVEFKRTVGKFKSQFSGYDQQDSQELLAFLMDGLQEDLNKVKQKPYLKAPDDDLDPGTASKIAWEIHKKRNESVMVELFDGLFMSTVKCMVCLKESRTFDTFSNLTLPLPSHASRCTLQDCLSLFTKPEKMTGDDKWFCPKCRQRREASKTIQIWRLPAILVVHLKRFQYEGMWRQKLQTSVSFPMSNLDMSNYVVGPKSTLCYNLHAVSNHYGTMHGGHYTAFAKNVYDKKWYKFDDQYVTEMSPNGVVTSAGYLLFYTSFDFQPPKHLFRS